MKLFWGIDLGGTKIEGVVIGHDPHGKTLSRIRIDTEAEKGYAHIVERVSLLVSLMSEELGGRGPERIGIGTPGVLDPQHGVMKNCNTTSLNGKPLKTDLEKALGVPVTLANDANCFALAEARLGAARPEDPSKEHIVFGVIMGTGVGGGVVVNGQVLSGCQGIAGEWGHNELDPKGDLCYCGRRGCVETVLSGPALERYYHQLSNHRLTLKEITKKADAGDKHALETMERLTSCFGKAIAEVINIIDPHVIILGGGVGNIERLYTDGVREARKHVFNNRLETKIVRPMLGDSAGVFGAAMLVTR
ncbi:MAG: ROK family protein [Chlorobiales bacterium]|nr:ROK family protein [Chlorobiales bacterium]